MTQERSGDTGDPMQSEHEEDVAQYEEQRVGNTNAADPTSDPGRRPTSDEDVAADADVVGDDQSPPGQNSDRLPQ